MQLISNKTLRDIEISLGLDMLDEDKKSDIMTEIIAIISSKAGVRIIKEFSKDEAEAFNRIPEGSLEEMEEFILAKNPNARAIFEEEAEKTKDEILKTKLDA